MTSLEKTCQYQIIHYQIIFVETFANGSMVSAPIGRRRVVITNNGEVSCISEINNSTFYSFKMFGTKLHLSQNRQLMF